MKKENFVKTLVETQVKTASEGRNADLDQTTISQISVRVKNLRTEISGILSEIGSRPISDNTE